MRKKNKKNGKLKSKKTNNVSAQSSRAFVFLALIEFEKKSKNSNEKRRVKKTTITQFLNNERDFLPLCGGFSVQRGGKKCRSNQIEMGGTR